MRVCVHVYVYLLRWGYALLLVEFCCLLGLDLQAQTFLESLVL